MNRITSICLYLGMAAFLFACEAKPEAIEFGKDHCHVCKMTLMDRKYGGEVVTTKGRIYKFDDTKCMVDFINTGFIGERDFAYKLVVDFENEGQLIDATTAFYLKSAELMSPMGGGIAAFSSKESLDLYKKKFNGFYIVWAEVLTDFK